MVVAHHPETAEVTKTPQASPSRKGHQIQPTRVSGAKVQQVFWQVLSGLANPYMLLKGCWPAPALEVPQGTSPRTNLLFASILAGGMASPEQGPPGQQLQPNSS